MTALSENIASITCICGDTACQIPHGLCHCGCGQKTQISKLNRKERNWIKGQPKLNVFRHSGRAREQRSGAAPFKIDGDYCLLLELGTDLRDQRRYVIVDAYKYDDLNVFRWHPVIAPDGTSMYAAKWVRLPNGKYRKQGLHQYLLNDPDDTVDHANGNPSDNRIRNLRTASRQKQMFNKRKSRNGIFPYKGLSFDSPKIRIKATIEIGGKAIHLGMFDTAEEAARAYDRAAIHYFGEFARLNFSRSDYEAEAKVPSP